MNEEENNKQSEEVDIYNDEGWYEDVRSGSVWKHRMWLIIRGLVALAVLVGLLYISGIYQSTFFTRTSPEAEPPAVEVVVDEEVKELPLRVVNIVEEGNTERVKDRGQVENLVNDASRLWRQASIRLDLEEYASVEVNREELVDLLNDPYQLNSSEYEGEDEGVTVFLVHSLHGVNGVAFTGSDTIALAEFTSVYNFRVLAHEVGHVLGLSHVEKNDRLMDKEARGVRLTRVEALTAREKLSEILERYQ